MGRYNNKRTQAAAQAMRNTPSRARFSKGPPNNQNRNKNKKNSGLERGGGRGNNRATATSRVIDKIQSRTTREQQSSKASTTTTTSSRIATTSEALQYLDKSTLDAIELSHETQSLISTLLEELGIINNTNNNNDVNDGDAEVATIQEQEEGDDAEDDAEENDDLLEEDFDQVLLEQSNARGTVDVVDYDIDNYYDCANDDAVGVQERRMEQQPRQLQDDGENGRKQQQDDPTRTDDDDDFDYDDKTFVHLTKQLSFTTHQAVRACNAIDGWDEAVGTGGGGVIEKKKKQESPSNNNALELAMDWLCLHLTQEELVKGFRPNPNYDRKQHKLQSQQQLQSIKAIPHPSISVESKPISEQAKDWADTQLLQQRLVSLIRLGFHHSEIMNIINNSGGTSSSATAAAEKDPILPQLIQKLRIEANEQVQQEAGQLVDNDEDDQGLLQEERDQELEALKAIYDDQMRAIRDDNDNDDDIVGRYMLTIQPSQSLLYPSTTKSGSRNNDGEDDDDSSSPCRLIILLPKRYPLYDIPYMLFLNSSLPPTFLRRINVLIHSKAYTELSGHPVVFETVSFLETELYDLYNDYIKEQRKKEFDAEQHRLLKHREVEMKRSEQIMLKVTEQDNTGDGTNNNLGRRQRAKLKAAEKAYDRPEQLEQLYKEYRRKQDERVEEAQHQNSQIRSTYAQYAIERRQKQLVEEEAERAYRAAMSASLNCGESVEEAREAAKRARTQSLKENGAIDEVEEDDDDASDVGKHQEAHEPSSSMKQNGTAKKESTALSQPTTKSSQFMERLRNSSQSQTPASTGEEATVATSTAAAPPVKGPTQTTFSFMNRLREMYDNAAQEKRNQGTTKSSSEKSSKLHEKKSSLDGYHLDNPQKPTESLEDQDDTATRIPRPVAVPNGELVDVMKDVIQQQEQQPWLISSEARVPSLNFDEKTESYSNDLEGKSQQISDKLRKDLERKRRLAEEWEAENPSVGDRRPAKSSGNSFSPEVYHSMMSVRQKLPAYQMKDDIIRTICNNQVTIIAGATGCGKTTQVPALLLDYFIENGRGSLCNVLVTQPRRISAIGVSQRIAQERCEKVGDTCG